MNIFEELVKLLIEKKLTVSAAESCTGGRFASEIVSVPNASSVLEASFVTYSERAKTELVGVDADIINSFGVVSEKTAIEMAKGASEKAHSDIGVGITGYAGPSTDENDDTVGTVCFGFFVNGKTVSSTKHFGDIGRNAVRELSVIYAAQTLIKLIKTFGE
ncbi:MAG: CinA family protein [Clostridia bacterium]|nr:CinA family protein [Clostridia bacterium]